MAIASMYYVNVTVRDPYGGVAYQNLTIVVLPPPSLQLEAFPMSWGALLLGVAALLVVFFLVARPRRRPVVEQAFFLDSAGEVRFVFAGPHAPFDETRLHSLLAQGSGNDLGPIKEPPYFLHIVPRDAGHWVVVSRLSDANRVGKAAESLFARADADVPSPPSADAVAESAS